MIKTYLTLMLFFGFLVVNAQSWTKKYFEERIGDDSMFCVAQMTDGNFVVAGVTTPSFGGGDILYYKIDQEGNIIWEYIFSGSAYQSAQEIIAKPDGGFLIAGQGGSGRIIIIDFDENGFQRNVQYYNNGQVSLLGGLLLLNNGDLLISGTSDKNPDPDVIETEFLLIRMDNNLEIIYDQKIELSNIDQAYNTDLLLLNDQHVITSIFQSAMDINTTPEMYIMKWNFESGTFIWEKSYGAGIITDLIMDNNGLEIQAAATYFENPVDDPFANQCKIMTIDLDGVVTKEFTAFRVDDCEPNKIVQLDDGSFVFSIVSINPNFGEVQSELIHVNQDGDEICLNLFFDGEQTFPWGLLQTEEKHILFLGNARTEAARHYPIISYLETACDDTDLISSTQSSLINFDRIKLYPNPCVNNLSIESDLEPGLNIKVIDSNGKLVFDDMFADNINVSDFEKGVYFLNIYKEQKLFLSKSFVKM